MSEPAGVNGNKRDPEQLTKSLPANGSVTTEAAVLPPTWDYQPSSSERSTLKRNFFAGCCAASRKPNEAAPIDARPLWDTADLGWWDFQKRRWRSFWLMKTIYSRSKALEEVTDNMTPGADVDRMWDEMHTNNAREIREHAENAKGLLIKACQFMSALSGVLPDPYVREFQVLTEDLPISSLEEVFRVIKRDLSVPPKSIFAVFSPDPIASASIAQVHKAKLRRNGTVVAVKVQHDGVDKIFLEDIGTLTTIAEQVVYWVPSLDFRKFCEEWAESLPRELDFQEERRALERAEKALHGAGIPCVLPKVHKEFTGRHVLVMDFIEAEPIASLGDVEFCKRHDLDKYAVLRSFLDAFGVMAFKDGLFHADPHAGNVRILLDKDAPGGAKPVLFDWGFFRELTDDERMGLARVFHCTANMDLTGLFDVLGKLGCKFKPELMTDDFRRDFLEKARGIMKDTVNKQTTRQEIINQFEEYKARIKREGENASYSPLHFLEEWPRCVVFFFRMLQIVRGLCVSVDASGMPILDIFARHAREALVESSTKYGSISMLTPQEAFPVATPVGATPALPVPNPARRAPSRESPSPHPDKNGELERRIKRRLDALVGTRKIVGAQVAVLENGFAVCDLAAGHLSSIDARAVESDTRFPLLGAAAGLASLALVRTLRRKHQRYNSDAAALKRALHVPLCSIWPKVGMEDHSVTLADLLTHRAGVQDLFPANFGPKMLDDIVAVCEHFEKVKLKLNEPRYAYLLQAFLLAKLGDCMTGKDSLLHFLGSELAPLGLDIAAPTGKGEEATVCRDLPQLARVSMAEVSQGQERRKQRKQELEDGKTAESRRSRTLLEALAHDPLTFDPLQANTSSGACFRAGLCLGVSARRLAMTLSDQGLQQDLEALHGLEVMDQDPTAIGWLLTGGACRWTAAGLQVFDLRGTGMLSSRQRGFGIACGLGPCAVHFPNLGQGGVTVAVMVNDVIRGREVAAELFTEVLGRYGYAPEWTDIPMRVMADALRLKNSPEAEPLMNSLGGFGGLKLLQEGFRQDAAAPTETSAPSLQLRLLQRAAACYEGLGQANTNGEFFGCIRPSLQRLGALCSAVCSGSKGLNNKATAES